MSQPELILFAKQPIPGQVKTRLQPEYSAAQAAEIAGFLIRATVELAVSAWPGAIYLYAWPDSKHVLFHELADRYPIRLAPQAEGDLGIKMLSALRQGIERAGSAAILGCDVPHGGGGFIDQANDLLAHRKNVLGPTEDGGYYFIGLSEARSELFEDVEWGSTRVLATTCARAAKLGMEFEMLTTLRDIDTAADLWLVSRIYAPLKRFISTTGIS